MESASFRLKPKPVIMNELHSDTITVVGLASWRKER